MKILGKRIGEPEPKVVVIERKDKDGDVEQFVFTLKAVFDRQTFDEICPKPKPKVSLKDGPIIDADYRKRVEEYSTHKTYWTILDSLSATDGLEWEKVKLDDPSTWTLFEDELIESGLTQGEINYLVTQITDANSIDEATMEEARERFFATGAKEVDSPQ